MLFFANDFWSVVNVCFWQVRAKEQENLELQESMADARKKHEVCNGWFFWYYIHILPVWMYVWETWYYLISRLLCNYLPPSKNYGSYLTEIWGRLIIIFWLLKHFDKLPNIDWHRFLNNFMWKFPFSWNDDSFIMTHNSSSSLNESFLSSKKFVKLCFHSS